MIYKAGDLVYFDGSGYKGVGKVVAITGDFLLVHSTQIASGHDGTPFVEKQDNKNNWWYYEEHLKPFTKKVGQRYKVLRANSDIIKVGDIVTLTNIYEDGVSYYTVEDEVWCLYDIDQQDCQVEFYADIEEKKENE